MRELSEAPLLEDLPVNHEEARRLADEWIADNTDDVRELQKKSSISASIDLSRQTPAASISSTLFWPWPMPYYRVGYCKMRYNPAYPTTYPYGAFWLHEYGPWAPLRIRGYMRQMPSPSSWHGFLINRNRFDGRDCKSTEPTWNPWGQPQGNMNSWPSRAGDLRPIRDNSSGYASWYGFAWQPTLYGRLSVVGRSMCIYEKYGRAESQYGRQIACCDIRRFWVVRNYNDVADFERAQADEDEIEVITEEEFEKMFGYKFDPKEFEFEGEMDNDMPNHFKKDDGNQ